MSPRFTPLTKPTTPPLRWVPASIMISTALLALCATCARPPASGGMAAVGQTTEVGGWRVTVHSFLRLPADEWRQPADRQAFCAVELTLENNSRQIRYMMPEKQMMLLDQHGRAYAPDRDAAVIAARSLQWPVPEGEFAASAQAHGAVTYQVPAESRGLRWILRDSLFPWARTASFILGDVPQP